ncbi:hypothetical protein KUDE01_002627 [Dissostichus eleginoides]|uniref:Uncharacterized protein n=1 Tax=Dissostichus eleginoides TaxID=100907 RepID=A0AAD9ETT3_DISEL|nr:hypothetical protein KUDE01_002627 [Dissostichus eleginoides]
MDAAMFQLRSFVHQRLYTAAEEILGEVEKTIKLAFEEDPSKDKAGRLQDLLVLRMKAAAERSLTSSTVESEDECDAPLLNQGPSTPEDYNCNAEIPGPSQTSSDQDNNNWNYCSVQTDFKMPEIKEEQEELWDDGQTQEMYLSSEIVKSEQDLQEGEISYELQPVSSDCSAAQSENNDSDDEGLKSKGEQTMKQNEMIFPGQSGSRLYRAAEDILGEVEKTIKLALLADGGSDLCEEEDGSPPPPLDLRKKSAAERSLTSSTVESEEDECDASLLQENPGPSTPEESHFNAAIPGPSQTSADLDNNDWNYCSVQSDFELPEIKEEQEELWDDGQTQENYFPSSVIVKSEQDLQEGEISYELEPVSSDCSAAESENGDRDEESRLQAASEKILGEGEKHKLALNGANLQRPKEEHNKPPLTGQEVLQETSIQAESNLSTAEVPVLSQTSADTDHKDGNYCLAQTNFKIKEEEEEEEIGNDTQAPEVILPSLEGVKTELQVNYELQPISSDFSAADSDSNDGDEEWLQNKGARTKKKGRKRKTLQKVNYELQPISSDFSPADSDSRDDDEEWLQNRGVQTKKKGRKRKTLQKSAFKGQSSPPTQCLVRSEGPG